MIPIRFAGQTGLYKPLHYQDFQPDLHSDRLVDILQNHRIYCSNPADFNDPWDVTIFRPPLLDDPGNISSAGVPYSYHIPGPNASDIRSYARAPPF